MNATHTGQAGIPWSSPTNEHHEGLGGALVGVLPILIWPLGRLLGPLIGTFFIRAVPAGDTRALQAAAGVAGGWLVALIYAIMLAILVAGRIKGWPRWVFPYAGLLLVATLMLTLVATPGLVLFGHTFRSNELWGWRAWIPVFLWLAITMIVTRSPWPFEGLGRAIRQDWSRISFGIYAMLPVALFITFDEVQGEEWYVALLNLLLAAGAWIYLRSRRRERAPLWLAGSLLVVWLAAGAYLALYWHGRMELGMAEPANGLRTLAATLNTTAILLLCLALPAFVAVIVRGLTALVKPVKPGDKA